MSIVFSRPRYALLILLLILTSVPLTAQTAENGTRVPRTATWPALSSSSFTYAQPEDVGLASEALKTLADSVESRVARGKLVGAEIMIIKDDRVVFHEAIGWSDLEKKTPLERNSVYRIRSMTKPFIATAVLMLDEDGLLSLDDKVSSYLPSFDNERSGAITIRQLLTYTSGLRDYGFFEMGLPKDPDEYESLRQLVDDVGEIGPLEPIGEFRYGGGSGVLPAVVSEITGILFERFIEKRILEPLRMEDTHTAFTPEAEWAGRMNSTHRWRGADIGYERYWDSSMEQRYQYFRGAGGLYSTTSDYARFLSMWMNEGSYDGVTLLSPGSVHQALRPLAGGQYGMQWRVPRTPIANDMPLMFGHAGSDGTIAFALPELNAVVLYFTQSRGPGVIEPFLDHISTTPPFDHNVASRWHAKLVGDNQSAPSPISAEAGAGYIGVYVGGIVVQGEMRMEGQWSYTIQREGEVLIGNLRRTGFESNHMLPPSHRLFHQSGESLTPGRMIQGRVVELLPDVRIAFDVGEEGEAISVTIESSGDQGPLVWQLKRQN